MIIRPDNIFSVPMEGGRSHRTGSIKQDLKHHFTQELCPLWKPDSHLHDDLSNQKDQIIRMVDVTHSQYPGIYWMTTVQCLHYFL